MSLEHLAFAVTNLRSALRLFKGLGYREAGQEQVSGVQFAHLENGGARIILMFGISRNTDVARTVKAYGPGPYRLGFRVPDLDAAIASLASHYPLGGQTAEDEQGRYWVSRRDTVTGLIFELIEAP